MNDIEKFIFRRAFRVPHRGVKLSDVQRAFGKPQVKDHGRTTFSNWLTKVTQGPVGMRLLERRPKSVHARLTAVPPDFVGEADLMNELARLVKLKKTMTGEDVECAYQQAFMQATGLTVEELPVHHFQERNPLPRKPGVLLALQQALTAGEAVVISYVGLRRHETGREYRILPRFLECHEDQWRVGAQDLGDAPTFGLKTFVLSRITACEVLRERLPRGFVPSNAQLEKVMLEPVLNRAMTREQRDVISHELRVDASGRCEMPAHCIFEYRQKFTGEAPSENIVWPLLERV